AKNIGLGGAKTAQIKIEVINLLNRLQPRGSNMTMTQGNAAFGRIVAQSGFMRMTQVMFRYSWKSIWRLANQKPKANRHGSTTRLTPAPRRQPPPRFKKMEPRGEVCTFLRR